MIVLPFDAAGVTWYFELASDRVEAGKALEKFLKRNFAGSQQLQSIDEPSDYFTPGAAVICPDFTAKIDSPSEQPRALLRLVLSPAATELFGQSIKHGAYCDSPFF